MKQCIWTYGGLLLLTCFALVFPGCTNLEEDPDFISPNNFYRNGDEVVTAVNGIYDDLGAGWGNIMYARYCFDCVLGYSIGYEKEPLNYASGALAPDSWVVGSYWQTSYRAINKANIVITRTPEVEMEEDLKRRVMGEAKFLRAFFYYHLAVYFDDIPVSEEPTTELGDYASNEGGKEKALQLAISDFREAVELLPESYEGADIGRATKWAALGFLAKTYLETGQWAEAMQTAEQVVNASPDNGVYLFDDFTFNFDSEHENMGERIFELQSSYTASPSENSNIHAHFTPTDWAGPDCNTTSASGWADAWIWGQPEFRMTYEDGDQRIQGTFLESYCSRNVNDIVTWDPNAPSNFVGAGSASRTYRSAYVSKYLEKDIPNWDRTERNFSFLRYADVLLAHSEAANEAGSGDPYLGINLVRTRAGLAPLSGLGQADLRDAIIEERNKEFAFEGQTLPNLKRKGVDRVAAMIEKYTGRKVDGNRDAVIPIPTQEVNANPNVSQNQYW